MNKYFEKKTLGIKLKKFLIRNNTVLHFSASNTTKKIFFLINKEKTYFSNYELDSRYSI